MRVDDVAGVIEPCLSAAEYTWTCCAPTQRGCSPTPFTWPRQGLRTYVYYPLFQS